MKSGGCARSGGGVRSVVGGVFSEEVVHRA